jgi:hypothetical protein
MSGQRTDRRPTFEEFQQLSKSYQKEPTLANYVRLRRRCWIDFVDARDFDPSSIQAELAQLNIDLSLVNDAIEGYGHQIDELALRLMEGLIEREKIERAGGTHLQSRGIAVSDGLIDYLIVTVLEALQLDDTPTPPSLVVLIRERLGGARPDRYVEYERARRRRDAIALAAIKFPRGKISVRKMAKLVGVEPSTISRWFPEVTCSST